MELRASESVSIESSTLFALARANSPPPPPPTNPGIDCNSWQYSMIYYEAALMIVIFVLGVPGFWLWSLHKHRADIQQTGDNGEVSVAAQQFSFLVGLAPGTSPNSNQSSHTVVHTARKPQALPAVWSLLGRSVCV